MAGTIVRRPSSSVINPVPVESFDSMLPNATRGAVS
jgi:hypothetical protein